MLACGGPVGERNDVMDDFAGGEDVCVEVMTGVLESSACSLSSSTSITSSLSVRGRFVGLDDICRSINE